MLLKKWYYQKASKMKKVCVFIILATAFLLGCQKGDLAGDTIILLGKETYVKSYRDLIPDSLFTKYVAMMNIDTTKEGYIPPNIEGAYIISPYEFCYSNFWPAYHEHELYLRVSGQHNRVAKVEIFTHFLIVADTVYIMGDDQNFTMYFTQKIDMQQVNIQQIITRNVFITGEKTDAGIRNLMFGDIMVDVEGDDNPYVVTFFPGWYNIYKDGDGFSENTDFFDNQ